jgi:hypothetical protein
MREDALERLDTIGEFYTEFVKGRSFSCVCIYAYPTYLFAGISQLLDSDFTYHEARQFSQDDFNWSFTWDEIVIRDKESAGNALKKIVQQGEGDQDTGPDERSHCDVFVDLYKNNDENWTSKTYNVPTNPKTEHYKTNVFVYKVR